MHPLWGDEAETALFARNILRCGVPCGWDGVNIMGINDAVVLNKELINHTSPWAQYYLAAASFKLFGESSFTARLPFILLSIISMPILYLLALKITGDKKTAFLTILITSLSIPYILFAYQARYFSLISLASLTFVFSCLNLLSKKIWPKILFVASGTLFFYGNYVVFVAFYAATFFSFLIYLLSKKVGFQNIKRFVLNFITLSSFIVLLTLPWYIIMKPFDTRGEIIIAEPIQFIKDFTFYFNEAYSFYNLNNGFPLLFIPLLALVVFFLIKKSRISTLIPQILIPAFFFLIMTIFTITAVVDTKFTEVRYTMVIFPYLLLLIGTLLRQIWAWNRYIAIPILAAYIFSNIFTLQPPRSFLWEFKNEVLNPYPSPDKTVADFLEIHAQKGDTAFVNLDRDHEPLIFHLRDKIKFVKRVSMFNKRIFPENRGQIPRYIYDFRDPPDWVIIYSMRGNDGSFFTFDHRPLPGGINLSKDYEEIILPIFFSDVSRPEIHLRSFRPIRPGPDDRIFIYKLKNKNTWQ